MQKPPWIIEVLGRMLYLDYMFKVLVIKSLKNIDRKTIKKAPILILIMPNYSTP